MAKAAEIKALSRSNNELSSTSEYIQEVTGQSESVASQTSSQLKKKTIVKQISITVKGVNL